MVHAHLTRLVVACLIAALLGVVPIAQTDPLADLLRRAAEFSQNFARDAATLVADESCQQSEFRLTRGPVARNEQEVQTLGRQSWRAEIAWVQTPELEKVGHPWLEIRDVFEARGKMTSAGEPRLASLFRLRSEQRLEEARRIVGESARFNIGPVRRNWNASAVPLLVLHPVNTSRFTFRKKPSDTTDRGRLVRIIEYEEKTTPTLIRLENDQNTAASGEIWLDATTGEVLRSVLRCGQPSYTGQLTVTYRRDKRLGLRVPSEMKERFESAGGGSWVEGSCKYSNFRRFETSGRLILQK